MLIRCIKHINAVNYIDFETPLWVLAGLMQYVWYDPLCTLGDIPVHKINLLSCNTFNMCFICTGGRHGR